MSRELNWYVNFFLAKELLRYWDALPLQELTMWEHSRRITQVLMEFPAIGLCEMHGIDDHVCLMYTASEDR